MNNKSATLELGTKPVGKLLTQYAIPAIIAMTASSLYNMVDSIFIGQGVGAMAIAGLAITFPFMNLSGAFGAAVGIGSSTLISVRLGKKDYQTAQNLLGNNITLNIIIGLLFGAICLAFLDPILTFFGASDETRLYAREYMEIILLGNVITHLYFGMNAILRSASKPKKAMTATVFTVMINAVLDPIFIYSWGLNLGIRGAAIATILSQFLALCWQMKVMSNPKDFLHLRRGIYRLKSELVRGIVSIGISPFAMNACACLVVIFINRSLMEYGGDLAVGAYGIGNRIAFMFVMVSIGINQGMQPIAGYNFGAKKYDRMMRVVYLAIVSATIVMTAGWLIGELAPGILVRLFTDDQGLINISEHGLRINMLVFPIIGFQMVVTNFFQSIGKAKISIFLSLSRQMLLLIPLLFILPKFWGIDGVWAALPASDALSAIIAGILMMIYVRKFKLQHSQNIVMQKLSGEEINDELTELDIENATEAPNGFAPWSTRTPRYSSLNS